MSPCPSCNRHVREETCPFCGAKCVQTARVRFGRVARGTLFAASAVALAECSQAPQPFYGGPCLANPDACVVPQSDSGPSPDASNDAPDAD